MLMDTVAAEPTGARTRQQRKSERDFCLIGSILVGIVANPLPGLKIFWNYSVNLAIVVPIFGI
jgi:hypothetical protein